MASPSEKATKVQLAVKSSFVHGAHRAALQLYTYDPSKISRCCKQKLTYLWSAEA